VSVPGPRVPDYNTLDDDDDDSNTAKEFVTRKQVTKREHNKC
jgi:hypothetical protein